LTPMVRPTSTASRLMENIRVDEGADVRGIEFLIGLGS